MTPPPESPDVLVRTLEAHRVKLSYHHGYYVRCSCGWTDPHCHVHFGLDTESDSRIRARRSGYHHLADELRKAILSS